MHIYCVMYIYIYTCATKTVVSSILEIFARATFPRAQLPRPAAHELLSHSWWGTCVILCCPFLCQIFRLVEKKADIYTFKRAALGIWRSEFGSWPHGHWTRPMQVHQELRDNTWLKEQRRMTHDCYPWSTRAHVSRDYIESPCTALEEHDQSVVKLPWFFFEICDVIMMQKCLLLMLLLTTGWENETCITWVLEFSWSHYFSLWPKILSGFIPLMSSSVLDSPGRVTTGSLVLMWKEMELLRQGPVPKGRSDGSDGTWDTWKILENWGC